MTAAVFQRVGPYEILSEIGRGGMATVFLAVDTRTGRRVALKLVPLGTDREAREILEAERWGAVLHERFSKICKQVPALYEYKTEGQYFCIAMEYVDGQNLSDLIAKGALLPDRAVGIAMELCRVLELAHEFQATIDNRQFRSLIHGDLKPRNVRLTQDQQLKVLDFGIAKALSLSRRVTRNDFGSRAYLSPERLESDGEVDAHADCWAVGVLLYEMLSGEQPFRAEDTRRLEKRITSRQPPEPLTARCPPGLEAIVSRMLAPRLAERYARARDIREDLERFRLGQRTLAEGFGWPRRMRDDAATRRTSAVEKSQRRPEADEQPTARTRAGTPTIPLPAPGARPSAPSPARAAGRRRFLPRLSFRAALLVAALFVVVNEACVAASAARLTPSVAAQELDGLPDLWDAYDSLAERSVLGFGVIPLERTLSRQTAELADRVIARYRTGSAVVWEPEWLKAREALARAAGLAGSGTRLRAALRYCEGHIHRINGEARKARREIEAAGAHFAHAVTAFREAAELRPDWPDPFLGLARTFIYGLDDVDRGADALEQAHKRGFRTGERETMQLADGFRRRAEALARTARKLGQLPQEQEYLSRAAEAYREALSLYGMLVTFDAAESIRATQRGLKRVTDRLEALTEITISTQSFIPSGDTPLVR